MKEDSILMCLIAFVLGFLVSRMMLGNGMSVGAGDHECHFPYIGTWGGRCQW